MFFFNLLFFLKKRETYANEPIVLYACVHTLSHMHTCIHTPVSTFKPADRFIKLDINTVPLKGTATMYFEFPTISKDNMEDVQTCEVRMTSGPVSFGAEITVYSRI
jgi:hypothetical protein